MEAREGHSEPAGEDKGKGVQKKRTTSECQKLPSTDMMTKCSVESWMASWNRKRILVGKLVRPE